jgi:hypothetical protein
MTYLIYGNEYLCNKELGNALRISGVENPKVFGFPVYDEELFLNEDSVVYYHKKSNAIEDLVEKSLGSDKTHIFVCTKADKFIDEVQERFGEDITIINKEFLESGAFNRDEFIEDWLDDVSSVQVDSDLFELLTEIYKVCPENFFYVVANIERLSKETPLQLQKHLWSINNGLVRAKHFLKRPSISYNTIEDFRDVALFTEGVNRLYVINELRDYLEARFKAISVEEVKRDQKLLPVDFLERLLLLDKVFSAEEHLLKPILFSYFLDLGVIDV